MYTNISDIESDIEKALTDFIREKLNAVSSEVFFDLGYWVNYDNSDGSKTRQIQGEGYYTVDEDTVIKTVIEAYDGNIVALEGLFNAEYTTPMTFQIPIEDPNYMYDVIGVINTFKNKLRGSMFRITVDTSNGNEMFTIVTSTDNVTPIGDIDVQMGEDFVYGTLNIYFDISKDISYGNQIRMYLSQYDEELNKTLPMNDATDYKRVYPLKPTISRNNSLESFQNFNFNEAVNIVKDTEYTIEMTLIVKEDDIHWQLLEEVVNKEKLNLPFLLRMDFMWYGGGEHLTTKFKKEELVIIRDAEVSYSIGENIFMNITVGKYFTDNVIQGHPDISQDDNYTGQLNKQISINASYNFGTYESITITKEFPSVAKVSSTYDIVQIEEGYFKTDPTAITKVTSNYELAKIEYPVIEEFGEPTISITSDYSLSKQEAENHEETLNKNININSTYELDSLVYDNNYSVSPSKSISYTSTYSFDVKDCPAYGTLLNAYCSGTTRVYVRADGNCGTYETTKANSEICGWTPTEYTVTFLDYDVSTIASITVEEGNNVTPPSNPTRQGYEFLGWFDDLGNLVPSSAFDNIQEDATYIATYNQL